MPLSITSPCNPISVPVYAGWVWGLPFVSNVVVCRLMRECMSFRDKCVPVLSRFAQMRRDLCCFATNAAPFCRELQARTGIRCDSRRIDVISVVLCRWMLRYMPSRDKMLVTACATGGEQTFDAVPGSTRQATHLWPALSQHVMRKRGRGAFWRVRFLYLGARPAISPGR